MGCLSEEGTIIKEPPSQDRSCWPDGRGKEREKVHPDTHNSWAHDGQQEKHPETSSRRAFNVMLRRTNIRSNFHLFFERLRNYKHSVLVGHLVSCYPPGPPIYTHYIHGCSDICDPSAVLWPETDQRRRKSRTPGGCGTPASPSGWRDLFCTYRFRAYMRHILGKAILYSLRHLQNLEACNFIFFPVPSLPQVLCSGGIYRSLCLTE